MRELKTKKLIWKSCASWSSKRILVRRRKSVGCDATIKYHKIFRIHFEKFLLQMPDIYEIITFFFSNSPCTLHFSSGVIETIWIFLSFSLSWKCFLRDSIIRFLDFLPPMVARKTLSELRKLVFFFFKNREECLT